MNMIFRYYWIYLLSSESTSMKQYHKAKQLSWLHVAEAA